MSKQAEWIKRHYIRPAIIACDNFFHTKEDKARLGVSGCSFEVNQTIWVTELLKEYRVVIPSKFVFDGNGETPPNAPLETRFITYIPTGKIVYDNSGPNPVGIVYEYILENLLGKKDLILR